MTTETLTFEFANDTQRDAVVDILASYFAYPAQVPGQVEQEVTNEETGEVSMVTVTQMVPNPTSKLDHVRNSIAKYLGGIVKEIMTEQARVAAKAQIEAQVNSIGWH